MGMDIKPYKVIIAIIKLCLNGQLLCECVGGTTIIWTWFSVACEPALWLRIGQKERWGGRGEKGGKRGRGEQPVEKGLKLPFHPLSISLSLI